MHSHEKWQLPNGASFRVILLSLLLTFSFAMTSAFFPLFIRSFVGSDAHVGYLSVIVNVVLLFAILGMDRFIQTRSHIMLLRWSSFVYGVCFFLIASVTSLWLFLIIEIIRSLALVIITICLGLLLKEETKRGSLPRAEGWSFSLINVVWLIAPVVGGVAVQMYSYRAVIAAIGILPLLFSLLVGWLPAPHQVSSPVPSIRKLLVDFFVNKRLRYLYALSIGLMMWWVFAYVFVPLHLSSHGFDERTIGMLLAAICIPLIMCEIPAASLTKLIGIPKAMGIGFVLMACFAAFGLSSNDWVFMIGLVLASFGAAIIEPACELYFFSIVPAKKQSELFPLYRTYVLIGRIFSLFFASLVLSALTFSFLVMLMTVVMCSMAAIAFMLQINGGRKINGQIHN